MSSSEWKEYKIKDVCTKIGSGATPRGGASVYLTEGNIKLIRSQNVYNNYIEYNGLVFIDDNSAEKLKNVVVKENDVLLNITGDSVARCTIVPKKLLPARVNQHVCILRANKEYVDPFYLKSYLVNSKMQDEMLSLANNGGTRAALTKGMIENFKIILPNIKEQKAISKILWSLDKKIENNNKINKKLEQMAQAIFKQWFVDFEFPNEYGKPYKSSGGEMIESELGMIPLDWEVNKLQNIIDLVKENTKSGEHLKDRKYVPIDTMPMKTLVLNDFKSSDEANSSLILFNKFDILIGAMRVYFHRVNLAAFNGVTRTTTFVLRSKRETDIAYNLLLLNLDETINYASNTSKGSTMPYAVWENGLGNMSVVYPPENLRAKFNNVVLPVLKNIINNNEENIILKNIRDTLLPKLMSGEIRVPID